MVPEQPSRLYWVRSLVLIFIPSIVTAYFGVIWIHLLQNSVHDEAAQYRTYSGSLIFYSWFIIGVFGLSWAKFGLVGIEASMLRSRFWGAPNLVVLLMHSNSTWSSPSGWVNAIINREFHRLWCLLAFLSLLPFIALPLSGLVFEISDGYISTSDAPLVIGRNISTFNRRYDAITARTYASSAPALAAWLTASAPVIPGIGILFTSESIDRSKHSSFERLPNSLSLTEPMPDLFLTPQPDKPVSGKAWGLRIKYNCSTVQSVSQFTILSQKSASSVTSNGEDNAIRLRTPSGDTIALWSSLNTVDSAGINFHNTQAYFEVGTRAPLLLPNETDYYDGYNHEFEADEGDASQVFEYAMWQLRVDTLADNSRERFNNTVEPSIEGIGSPIVKRDNGTYVLNDTFFTIEEGIIESGFLNKTIGAPIFTLSDLIRGSSFGRLLDVAPPIGVRCVSSSDLGTAELDGITSTFRSFQRSSPELDTSNFFTGALRFGRTTQYMLDGQYFQHYQSGGLPGAVPGRIEESRRFEQFVDQDSLLRSVNLAYALDASNLMFDSTSNFKGWTEPGLTASREGRILTVASLIPGAAVGHLVLALFCVWAALSAGLGLWYGFRRRPADRLDGYVMLRKGADMAADLTENNDFMGGKPYHDSGTLAALPGNVLGAKN
ncbi:hypothetical protein B0I35DRAFT_362799 [Stachybotrys elegans]|uniref:Uncharacterized protein n=1 Tax=Stachybotrys elegans TaxID=80388 RepID=A0A8K0SJD9_9HYPO|nr:hypothetical protein B0I35DRAFT_362799 [Stachybotrys elegans]